MASDDGHLQRHEHEPAPGDDLLWRALCYIAGELAPDEAGAFEARLDRDQSAREAVARAVELAGAVAALPPEVAAGPASHTTWPSTSTLPIARRRPLAALAATAALAAAACLGWLLVVPRGTSPAPGSGAGGDGVQAPSPTVTLAWSTLRQESDDEAKPDDGLPAWGGTLAAAELEIALNTEPEAAAGEASEAGLSPWLLDAATLARDRTASPASTSTSPSPAKEP